MHVAQMSHEHVLSWLASIQETEEEQSIALAHAKPCCNSFRNIVACMTRHDRSPVSVDAKRQASCFSTDMNLTNELQTTHMQASHKQPRRCSSCGFSEQQSLLFGWSW